MYITKWGLSYASIMIAMCLDNVCWIPDSPEWPAIKKNFKIVTIFGREFGIPINKEGVSYTWNKRILEVLKHPRDIYPAVISSSIMAAFL